MGKERHLAATVEWGILEEAIRANPHNTIVPPCLAKNATAAVLSLPSEETPVSWLPAGWTEDTTFTITDPISLALWLSEPIYRSASPAVRRTMEMEEASNLMNAIDSAWKAQNGRARGWVRKHLEEDLRGRSSGEDPLPNAWEEVRTKKRTALLLDYVCCMRRFRIALWWKEQSIYTVFPLTGGTGPIPQLNAESAHMLIGPAGFTVSPAEWVRMIPAAELTSGCKWQAPAAAPSAGSLTVSQIQELLREAYRAIGYTDVNTNMNRTALWNSLQWAQLLRDFQ
jgi:hypothetical protein